MEREVVHLLQEAGIGAERVPLSGAAGGSYTGDVSFPVKGRDWLGEVKFREDGFGLLYRAVAKAGRLRIASDPELVALPLSDFIDGVTSRQNLRLPNTTTDFAFPEIKMELPSTQLRDWLGDNDALFVRRARERWLIVLPVDRFLEALK